MSQYKNITRHMTLQEVASELGVTAERVRQIENEALAKIRKKMAEKGLASFDVVPDNFTWNRS